MTSSTPEPTPGAVWVVTAAGLYITGRPQPREPQPTSTEGETK